MSAFQGGSTEDLQAWLKNQRVDTSTWGQGAAKPVFMLWQEASAAPARPSPDAGQGRPPAGPATAAPRQPPRLPAARHSQVREGETSLSMADGRLLRRVTVLNVLIRDSQGRSLIEHQQVLPTGSVRTRDLPLSEKLLPGESWRDAVVRAVAEELGEVLPPGGPQVRRCPRRLSQAVPSQPMLWSARWQGSRPAAGCLPGSAGRSAADSARDGQCCASQVEIDDATYRLETETKESQSYPGVSSQYTCHRVAATVEGLPSSDFMTTERRADGTLRHRWVWR